MGGGRILENEKRSFDGFRPLAKVPTITDVNGALLSVLKMLGGCHPETVSQHLFSILQIDFIWCNNSLQASCQV